jgi:hypothetical protein
MFEKITIAQMVANCARTQDPTIESLQSELF